MPTCLQAQELAESVELISRDRMPGIGYGLENRRNGSLDCSQRIFEGVRRCPVLIEQCVQPVLLHDFARRYNLDDLTLAAMEATFAVSKSSNPKLRHIMVTLFQPRHARDPKRI